MSLLGTQVKFPGSFWEGRMTAEEKAADYLCTVLDFQIAHRMQPGAPPTQAFQLQEMGKDGTCSHKHCAQSSRFNVKTLNEVLKRMERFNSRAKRGVETVFQQLAKRVLKRC